MEARHKDLSLYDGKDPRELPIYSIDEAAHILWLAPSTLKAWTVGQTWHEPSGKERRYVPLIIPPSSPDVMLSFINLVEAHVLQAIRRVHKIKMLKVREAMRVLRKEFETLHPLAQVDLYTEDRNLLVKLGGYVNVSHGGQIEMQELVGVYLTRIEREEHKIARFYPFAGEPRIEGPGLEKQPKFVSVDPFVSFGRPVVAGTNVRTEIVAERFFAGDSVDDLAKDFRLDKALIEAAVRFERSRLPAEVAA